MSVKDNIDIYLITFNRCDCLQKTLNKFIADNSPIKDLDIKILDNCSTDDTQKICEEFITKHSNFKYIRNSKNLGISGNIIRAMELASKKWLWILCDDDDYDWSNWGEIEEALNSDKYDIVHTTYNAGFRNETYPYLINEESFIPNPIYRSGLIDSYVMQNAYTLAYTLLPHHAIGCKVLNEKGKIFVPKNRLIIQQQTIIEEKNWFRVEKENLHHRLNNYNLLSGYIQSYGLINDKKLKEDCCDVMCMGSNFYNSMNWFLNNNPRGDLFNIFDMLLNLSEKHRKDLIEQILSREDINKKNYVSLLKELIKIEKNLYKTRLYKKIFQITKTETHRIYNIFGIKLKIRSKKYRKIN